MNDRHNSISGSIIEHLNGSGIVVLKVLYSLLNASGPYAQLRVRKALLRLVASGFVERPQRGHYRLKVLPARETAFKCIERTIRDLLVSCGGCARTRELHRVVWGSSNRGERPYEYYLVHRVLRESSLFAPGRGHGSWTLAQRI